MKRKISTIFFDIGETLVTLKSLLHSMNKALIIHKEIVPYNKKVEQFSHEWANSIFNKYMNVRKNDFLKIEEIFFYSLIDTIKEKNKNLDNKKISEVVSNSLEIFKNENKIFPDVIPTLKKLKQKGYTLGFITDSDSGLINGIMKKHDLKKYFDIGIISSEMKIYKPNQLLFDKAIKLSKTKPENTIYIGDSEMDIEGAQKAKFLTIIIKRGELPHQESNKVKPDYKIYNLSELIDILSDIDLIYHNR